MSKFVRLTRVSVAGIELRAVYVNPEMIVQVVEYTDMRSVYLANNDIIAVKETVAEILRLQYPTPRRGDDVEAWIKSRRDEWDENGNVEEWTVLDNLLDEYRLRADTGASLRDEL